MPGGTSAELITVGLADDHEILTDALSAMVSSAPDMHMLFAAGDCASLRAALMESCPRVLLLDVKLPDGDGIEMLPEIHALCPQAAVLVLTSLSDEATLVRALDSGAAGFMPKRRPLIELFENIRAAAAGEIVVPTNLLRGLLGRKPRGDGKITPKPAPLLTERERQILQLLAEGASSAEIAERLTIAPATVRTHVNNLLSKMDVHSRLQAVAYAQSRGMVERPS